MDWNIVSSVVVGMAIFVIGIAVIGTALVLLMVRKLKRGVKVGASQKFSFPCSAFFGQKTEPAGK